MIGPNILALIIFCLAYVLFVLWPAKRTLISIIGAVLLIALGVISPGAAFWAINWNVMGMFVGMLVVADIFMASRVPAWLAEIIADHSKNTAWAILFICFLTGFISAFVENVATVLIIAPIALSIAKRLKFSPVKMMIAIAVSSNLQGTATLIGDPPSMLLGGFAQMNFMDFFFYHGKPSIFWAVELGALVSLFVLYWFFRKYQEKQFLVRVEKIRDWFPTVLLVLLILLLAGSSYFPANIFFSAGFLCMAFGLAALLYEAYKYKASVLERVKALDWETTFFLIGVFVLVGSITATGWIELLAQTLTNLVGGNVFLGYTLLVFFSVAVSAVVDNVPFLVTMLPVAISMSDKLEINPSLFLFGLLIGTSLGGNITPIGASANVVALGVLKKEGYRVSFREFMEIGIPFTLTAVFAAYLFIWFIWR